jgi:hypothetical protein
MLSSTATTSSSSSSSSSSSAVITNNWFKDIDDEKVGEVPARHWFYNAGRRLMVSKSS